MWPLLGGLISGGASLLGGFFNSQTSSQNNQANIQMQRETNEMNVEEAQKNRDFQQYNSNTAYVRASQDMRNAGLNPAMMFGSGSAASSPSGSVPSLTAPHAANPGSPWQGLGEAANKAISSAVQIKTMDKMADEMSNLEVENRRLGALIDQTHAATATEVSRNKNVQAQTANVEQDTLKQKLDRARQEWEAIKYLDLSSIPDVARKAGNIGSWSGNAIGDTAGPIISSALGMKRFMPYATVREGGRNYAPDGKSFDEFWKTRTGWSK